MAKSSLKKVWQKTHRGLAGIVAGLVMIVAPSIVLAHATLVRSDPADGATLAESPRQVRLWFDEEISPQFSSAQLFDVNSQPVEITGIEADPADPHLLILSLPELPSGVYSVLWKVLSETDGHFSQGLLVFGVGEEAQPAEAAVVAETDPAPPWPEVLLRWLNFSLLAGLVGAVATIQLVLVPGKAGGGEKPSVAASRRLARQRVLRWASWCARLALLVGFGLLLWQAQTLQGSLPDGVPLYAVAWQILSQTRWGALWLVRQVILLAVTGLLFWLHGATAGCKNRAAAANAPDINPEKFSPAPRPLPARLFLVTSLLLLALLTAQALTGHAAALAPHTSLAVVIDALHLLAASLWVGGLLALAIGLLPQIGRYQARADVGALLRAGWRPFSQVAALSVGLLVATGLYSAGRQAASIDALITTLYGRVLLGKVGLMLGVGGFGMLNAMLLHPQMARPLARLLRRPAGWTPLSIRRLPGLVLAETGLGLLVLLATGLITAAPTARGSEFTVAAEEIPSALSQPVDDMVVTLLVKPNRPGRNVFTVFAASTRRPPPAEILRVILRFTYLDQDLGRVSATAEEVEPGRFLVGGNYLSLAGPWQIEVVVRRKGLEDSVARFNWIVAPPGESRPVVISKTRLEPLLTFAAAGIMVLVLLATVGVRLGWNPPGKPGPPPSQPDNLDHIFERSGEPPGLEPNNAADPLFNLWPTEPPAQSL